MKKNFRDIPERFYDGEINESYPFVKRVRLNLKAIGFTTYIYIKSSLG
jgi:hypothetical protein